MEKVVAPTFYDGRVMIRKFKSDEGKFVFEISNKEDDTVDTHIFDTEKELNASIADWGKNYKFNDSITH